MNTWVLILTMLTPLPDGELLDTDLVYYYDSKAACKLNKKIQEAKLSALLKDVPTYFHPPVSACYKHKYGTIE